MSITVTGPIFDSRQLEWNSPEKCSERLARCTALLSGEKRGVYIIEGFTRWFSGLDLDLLGKSLGWAEQHRLVVDFKNTNESVSLLNRLNPTSDRKAVAYTFVDCRVMLPAAPWRECIKRALQPGDFQIAITPGGKLETFKVRLTGPLHEEYKEGAPPNVHVRSVEGEDQRQLLDSLYGMDKNRAIAEVTDIMLGLLQQRAADFRQQLFAVRGTPSILQK